MPNHNNKETQPQTPAPLEKVKVVYNGDVTWTGNIGTEEIILIKGEEYELPLTDFVQSLIGQKLLLNSSNK